KSFVHKYRDIRQLRLGQKNIKKKVQKVLVEREKCGMFAAAKTGMSVFGKTFLIIGCFWSLSGGMEIFFKKKAKSIVGDKKGFYICTRQTRKRGLAKQKKFY
ncbi:hypothetical protein, partial [Aestuariivivens sp. NBU2969]|uniref:hypothetical protein n=1 Tax=Aestuariivivens sp. NBU2969 TaxID=2873267 RepID=UPI001CBE5D7D